jgi:pilus assembly protein Flp/PilA
VRPSQASLDRKTAEGEYIARSTDESGATAIEYGVVAGTLSIVIVGAVNALGLTVKGNYMAIAQLFK